jgi:hypothetical protein
MKKRVKWVGHVAHIAKRSAYRVVVGTLVGQNDLEDLGVDVGIILQWILQQ